MAVGHKKALCRAPPHGWVAVSRELGSPESFQGDRVSSPGAQVPESDSHGFESQLCRVLAGPGHGNLQASVSTCV